MLIQPDRKLVQVSQRLTAVDDIFQHIACVKEIALTGLSDLLNQVLLLRSWQILQPAAGIAAHVFQVIGGFIYQVEAGLCRTNAPGAGQAGWSRIRRTPDGKSSGWSVTEASRAGRLFSLSKVNPSSSESTRITICKAGCCWQSWCPAAGARAARTPPGR